MRPLLAGALSLCCAQAFAENLSDLELSAAAEPTFCEGASVDLTSLFPPVSNVRSSPWCSTYNARELVMAFSNAQPDGPKSNRAPPPPIEFPSALALNALSVDGAPAVPKASVHVDSGADAKAILLGLQNVQGEIATEWAQPTPDQFFASNKALIKTFLLKNAKPRSDTPYESSDAFVSDDGIKSVVESDGSTSRHLEQSKLTYENRRKSGLRESDYHDTLKYPPFSIQTHQYSPNAAGYRELFEDLRRRLLDKKPVSISICSNSFSKSVNPDWIPTDSCGAHRMNVVGYRRDSNGSCRVKLRNTWGEEFGDSGSVELSLKDLVANTREVPVLEISSLSRARSWTDNPNTLVKADGTIMVGKFASSRILKEGLYKGAWDETHWYEGEVVQSHQTMLFQGKGFHRVPATSFAARGTFAAGSLVSGCIWNFPYEEKFYSGPIKNSQLIPAERDLKDQITPLDWDALQKGSSCP